MNKEQIETEKALDEAQAIYKLMSAAIADALKNSNIEDVGGVAASIATLRLAYNTFMLHKKSCRFAMPSFTEFVDATLEYL